MAWNYIDLQHTVEILNLCIFAVHAIISLYRDESADYYHLPQHIYSQHTVTYLFLLSSDAYYGVARGSGPGWRWCWLQNIPPLFSFS